MADDLTTPFDLGQAVVGLHRDGTARRMPDAPGPPARIDGYTIGAPLVTHPAPHGGEMHPDGDELLFLVSGSISVFIEQEGRQRVLEVEAGEAVVIPRGAWHRVVPNEPSQMVHVTPGPRGEWRPLAR